MRLNGGINVEELRAICEDAYRTVAPRRLIMLLDGIDHLEVGHRGRGKGDL